MRMLMLFALLAADPSPRSLLVDDAVLDKVNGFQKAEWGMAVAQVSKIYPRAEKSRKDDRNRLATEALVSNLKAILLFEFDDKFGLVEVTVVFKKGQGGSADQLYDATKKVLVDKYGTFAQEQDMIGHAATWRGAKTILTLTSIVDQVTLGYASRAFSETPPKVSGEDL